MPGLSHSTGSSCFSGRATMARLDRLLWLFPLTARCYAKDCVRRSRLAFLLPFNNNTCSSLTVSRHLSDHICKRYDRAIFGRRPGGDNQTVIAGAHQQLFDDGNTYSAILLFELGTRCAEFALLVFLVHPQSGWLREFNKRKRSTVASTMI